MLILLYLHFIPFRLRTCVLACPQFEVHLPVSHDPLIRANISFTSLTAVVKFSYPSFVIRTLSRNFVSFFHQCREHPRRKPTFNPNAAHIPVLVQYIHVNIFAMLWVFEIWLNNEAAEINLLYRLATFAEKF